MLWTDFLGLLLVCSTIDQQEQHSVLEESRRLVQIAAGPLRPRLRRNSRKVVAEMQLACTRRFRNDGACRKELEWRDDLHATEV